MRRLLATFFGSLLMGLAPLSAAAQDVLSVPLDHSVKFNLPPGTKRVMVGAAGIVDITVLDMNNAVLLGRTFGTTNILVLDGAGRTLINQEVAVVESGNGRVTLVTGPAGGGEGAVAVIVQNYACSPRCIRYPMPGEAQADSGPYTGEYDSYPSRVGGSRAPAAAPAAPSGPLGGMTALAGVSQAMGSVAGSSPTAGP
jgi:hypothetical protein